MDFLIDPQLPIAERNARFDTLTEDEKRAEVARHAVALLESRRITPSHADYFYAHAPVSQAGAAQNEQGGAVAVYSILEGKRPGVCHACVMGSVFAAKTFLTDRLHIEAGEREIAVGPKGICAALEGVFLNADLFLMEAAYELRSDRYSKSMETLSILPEGFTAVEFGREYEDSRDRQIAILKRVIANGGKVDFTGARKEDTPQTDSVVAV